MKKRLFISSILMTLVLLVAITTATFAWYQASGVNASTSKSASLQTLSQATITDAAGTSELVFNVSGAQDKLVLTAASDIADDSSTTIAVSKGQTAYYSGQTDRAHMHILSHDDNHKASILVTINVAPSATFSTTDQTIYFSVALGGVGRLGASVTGTGNDAYVDANTVLYGSVTVSGGTFSATNFFAYVSMSGTTGNTDAAAELAAAQWTFAITDKATHDAGTALLTSEPS